MAPDEALAAIFLTDDGIDDPTPYYHQLRNEAPVHHSASGAIFLTRFEDCRELLRDNRFGKAARDSESLIPSSDPDAKAVREAQLERAKAEKRVVSMLFLNPPHHTRQRGLVSRAFTPRRVEQLRDSIRQLADDIVGAFVAEGGGDFLKEVAFTLPVAVIGTMVGVPEDDWPRFRSIVAALTVGIEPAATADELREAGDAQNEIRDYFKKLVAVRRADPRDDLLSDLIAVDDDGDTLSDEEIISVAILLFSAGFETTTNLIGNGMGALLANPDEMKKLWADPTLCTSAVDEMLRFDSPVQLDGRSALEAAEIAGVSVEPGQRVMTLLGAANRDPAQFTDPDRFDITRDEGPPMSFASGIHYCLGANLARAEGQEVFGALIRHCASVEASAPLKRRNRVTLRGFESIPLAVSPAGGD